MATTIVFNAVKTEQNSTLSYEKIEFSSDVIKEVLDCLYKKNIASILIEGGQKLLQSFIQSGHWDEVRIITNQELIISSGINAPTFFMPEKSFSEIILSDRIDYYCNQ